MHDLILKKKKTVNFRNNEIKLHYFAGKKTILVNSKFNERIKNGTILIIFLK